MIKTITKRKN